MQAQSARLGNVTVSLGEWLPTFRRNTEPSSTGFSSLRVLDSLTRKMEVLRPLGTSETTYPATHRHMSADFDLQQHRWRTSNVALFTADPSARVVVVVVVTVVAAVVVVTVAAAVVAVATAVV